jgi:hypothetical protein
MKKLILFISWLAIFNNLHAADNEVYVAKYKNDKACAISYTFDDGLNEHYTLVAPGLENLGFRGTFWVNGLSVETNNDTDKSNVSWEELKEMSKKGHEISNHGWSHKNLTEISLEEVATEIGKNDSIIVANIGVVPRTFCYPYNALNEKVLKMASKNRVDTRTKQIALGGHSTPEKLDQWVNELLNTGEWGVGMTHGITYGYDAFNDSTVLWNHLRKVKSMEDRIWVGTFLEVASYIKERDKIKIKVSAEGKKQLKITPELQMDKKLFVEPLTLVVKRAGIKGVEVKQGKKKLSTRIFLDKVMFDFNPYSGPIQVKFKK